MRIAERYENGAVVVDLFGAIRGAAGNEVTERVQRLIDAGHRMLVLNLSGVPAMDAGGLGALTTAADAARASGGVLRLAGALDRIDDLLVLTRLLTAFQTFDSVEQALESLTPVAAANTRLAPGVVAMA